MTAAATTADGPVPGSTRGLRYAVVGAGAGIFTSHRAAIQAVGGTIVGCADVVADIGADRAWELACPFVTDHRELASYQPDVAVVITPHPYHAALTIDMLDAGCHVLVEKPVATHVGEARAMVEAAERAGRHLGVCYQQRTRETTARARDLLRDGAIGTVQSVRLAVAYPRTRAYYGGSAWRGTWRGEGGGVVMNQGTHALDVMVHLVGPPSRVSAWTRTARHRIETEDSVSALLEWRDGAVGQVQLSTAEAGRDERLEITGTRGVLTVRQSQLRLRRFERDFVEYLELPEEFVQPRHSDTEVVSDGAAGSHAHVYRNFEAAIGGETEVLAAGADAARSLELSNALLLSGQRGGAPVTLPLDVGEYRAMLDQLIAQREQR